MTNIVKCAIINSRRTAKTVGGSNLPPEMEVSNMSVSDVISLLLLITNIVELVFNICNNKKK